MGGLHQGHARLISASSLYTSGETETLVSVFVNPLQFSPNEDFARYHALSKLTVTWPSSVVLRQSGALMRSRFTPVA